MEVNLNTDNMAEDTGINITNVDGYSEEIKYFISCVEKGEKPCRVTPQSSQESIKLVERFMKNAEII